MGVDLGWPVTEGWAKAPGTLLNKQTLARGAVPTRRRTTRAEPERVGTARIARKDGRERPFVARLCPPYGDSL
jgi:hypothetical protein